VPTTRSRPSKATAARTTYDDATWRATHATREYVVPGLAYEDYAPAYRYGVLVKDKHGNKEFAEVEPMLAAEWAGMRGASPLDWPQARPAVQEAYAGVVRVQKVKAVKAVKARAAAKTRTTGTKTVTRRATAGTRTTSVRGRTTAAGKTAAKKRTGGDNLRKRGPQDRARINVNESWEVDYWCERLGVTPARLRSAVKKVGPLAKDVRRELGK
jgi:hypothetical protein